MPGELLFLERFAGEQPAGGCFGGEERGGGGVRSITREQAPLSPLRAERR